jgi:hypothetical protein
MSNMTVVLREAGIAYPSRAPEFTPGFLVRFVLPIYLGFFVLSYYVSKFWVPCCDVRYNLRINTMLRSSLHPLPVVCRRSHALQLFVGVLMVCRRVHALQLFVGGLMVCRRAHALQLFVGGLMVCRRANGL